MSTQKTIDYLKEDPPLVVDCRKSQMKQNWAVVSFISPEDRIQQRFFYEANRFLYHDVNQQILDTTTHVVKNINTAFSNSLEKKINTYKTSVDPVYKAVAGVLDTLRKDMQLNEDDETNKVLRTYKLDQKELTDRFETYKTLNSKELSGDFERDVTEETSVRGLKIRGVFEELEDARNRAKYIRDKIESVAHVHTMPVGYWCPWDPNADAIQDQDYMLPQLNDLMGKYQRNTEQRNEFFQKDKQQKMDAGGQQKEQSIRDRLKEKVTAQQHQRLSNEAKQSQGLMINERKKKKKTHEIDDVMAELNAIDKKKKIKKVKTKAVVNETPLTITQNVDEKSITFDIPKVL